MDFTTVARGDGKVYQLVNVAVPPAGSLRVRSVCGEGKRLPAFAFAKEQAAGEYVIALPMLSIDQTVTAEVLDAGGKVVEAQDHVVGHLASALESKFNTLSRNESANDIRNIDAEPLESEAHVVVDRIMRFGYEDEGNELVHGVATAPCASMEGARAPMTFSVFDRQGEDVELTNPCVLSDTMDTLVEGSDFLERTIEFSFRKSVDVDAFFVAVRFEGDASPDGFVGIEARRRDDIRAKFEDTFCYTGQCDCYEPWFYANMKQPPRELAAQRRAHFDIEPLFSIIVPLYKTPVDMFREMVESVLAQTYGKFELLLVNSTPEDEALAQAVSSYAHRDERIRVIELAGNGGIALNTNEGIRQATGDFLSFFDHDDVLEPGILYEYVAALNRYPQTDLFYCDEDKLRDGHLLDGFLKPDFSWELLATCNYVCHLLTVRKSMVDQVELSGKDVDGAQDWDMTLKIAEKARNIFHVRKVLYHWRMTPHSAAANADAKPYTHTAGELAVKRHYDRIGVPVNVVDSPFSQNMHRIDYLIPEPHRRVSIVIPTKDHVDMLDRCLRSIWEKTTYDSYEIVLVENNSTEGATFDYYEHLAVEHPEVKVVRFEGAFNFSAICNQGAAHTTGDYLVFLNNDTEVSSPNWIELLLGPLQRDEVACTGAFLLYPDDTIQHAGVIIPRSNPKHVGCMMPKTCAFYFGMLQNAREVSAVTGACMMVKRDCFDAVNGFDEQFDVAFNDTDLCLRFQHELGKTVVVEPRCELYHYESVTRGDDRIGLERRTRGAKDVGMFEARWPRYFSEGDPLYSTNIDIASAFYGLHWKHFAY